MPKPNTGSFIRPGLGAYKSLQAGAASSAGTYGTRYDFSAAYAKWGMRVQVVGAASEVIVQLQGGIATSSDANSSLVPLTTYQLTLGSCDQTIWIVDRPVTSVVCQLTTVGLATGTQVNSWITGCP